MIFTNPCICECEKQNIRTQLIILTQKPSVRKIAPDFKGSTVAMVPKHMMIKSHYMSKPLHHAETAQNLLVQNQQLLPKIYQTKQKDIDEGQQKQNIMKQNVQGLNQLKSTKRQTQKKVARVEHHQNQNDLVKTKRRTKSYYPELTIKLLQRQNHILRKEYQQLKKQQKQLQAYKSKFKEDFNQQKQKFVKSKHQLRKSCANRSKEIQQLKQILVFASKINEM